MTGASTYYTIEKPSVAEYKDRGSTFLAYAFPIQTVDDFKKRLKSIKEEHPKAAHHCFAYRLGWEGEIFRSSDDGEPSNSAGKPILGQLDSKKVTNTTIIVVRYFGGTLLGVPGLITAYKTAASFALQLTPIIQKPVLVTYALHFEYTLMNEIMLVIKRFDGTVLTKEMLLFCSMKVGIPKENENACLEEFKKFHSVEITALA